MSLEAWLDETPGETRAIVARDGRYERLLIHRDSDVAEHRLGARVAGRVARVEPTLGGAFVDLGAAGSGFLAFKGPARPNEGARVEVEVIVEPRGDKGPGLSLIGPVEGEPRLLSPGPDAAAWLKRWAPDVAPVGGLEALRAGLEAEAEALSVNETFADAGIDLAVERTRALVAVDVDHAGAPGRGAAKAKAQANRFALMQAARMIRLRGWGGLVVVDLVGAGHDGAALTAAARAAFAGDGEVALGPVSRFGLLQLSLPWRFRPVEEILNGMAGQPTLETRAITLTRALHEALLADTGRARIGLSADPEVARAVAGLVERLGPRAALIADPSLAGRPFQWQDD